MVKAETALADEHVSTYRRVVRLFITAAGLGWSPAHEALADALLRAFANAERDENGRVQVAFPEPETTEAREAIDRALRHRYAAEANEAADSPPHLSAASDPRDELEGEPTATTQAAISREIAAVLAEPDDQSEAIEDESTRENCQGSSDPLRGPLAEGDVAISRSQAEPELPVWEALPQDWKAKYALNPSLGRWEYAQAMKRERREAEEAPRRRQSSHVLFRHPGLQS